MHPFRDTSMKECPSTLNVDDWRKILSVGNIYERFCEFMFSKKLKTMKDSTGKSWINNRIEALLDLGKTGKEYYTRLEKQIELVEKRLQAKNRHGKRMHGSCTNALVCQVFLPSDLEKACKPRPNARNLPCLTMLDFKPKGSKLSIFAVFRSQFFDIKAYGNLISLAILLYRTCQKTDYEPSVIISTANNATFHDKSQMWPLYNFLLDAKKKAEK